MVKWFKITKNQYFGFFPLGVALLFLQELPYIIMPLIPLQNNILMDMEDKIAALNIAEKILGVSCIVVMFFLVRSDAKPFSLKNKRELIGFSTAAAALTCYYIGWIFYFQGFQSLALILIFLVAMPPLYYASIGLWLKNYTLSILGIIFLIVHISNVLVNLI
jgi:hypothetical protein